MIRNWVNVVGLFLLLPQMAFAQDPDPAKELETAIRQGKAGIVLELIKDRSLVEQFYIGGNRPLHIAVEANQPEVARVLLDAGADSSVVNHALRTPLDLTFELRSIACIRPFYDHAPDNLKLNILNKILDGLVRQNAIKQFQIYSELLPEGVEPDTFPMDHFFLAASSGSVNILEYFHEQGRSYSGRDITSGWTVPHFLAAHGNVATLQKLIGEIPDLNVVDAMGQTALCAAAATGCRETVKILLDAGADPKIADANGFTALHHAAKWGDVTMARGLIAGGADAAALTVNELTALDVALLNNHAAMTVVFPMDVGAPESTDGDFGLVLSTCRKAILTGRLGQLKRQLESSNPSLDARDKRGFALLHYAVLQNSVEMVQTLLDAGADVNVQDSTSRWTPLMLATGGGQVDVAKVLLMGGANVNLQELRGVTALHLAFTIDNDELIAAIRLAQPDESLVDDEGKRAADMAGYRAERIAAQQAHEVE